MGGHVEGPGHRYHGANVFGETTSAKASPGEQKLKADARVVADAATNVINVRPNPFAEIGHLIDKTDLGGQHGVGHVLGHLRTLRRHDKKRSLGAQERRVEFVQYVGDFLAAHAYDYTIGPHEVIDGCAFLKELRVAGNVDGVLGAGLEPVKQGLVCADRNG